jgi:hypothetical protein
VELGIGAGWLMGLSAALALVDGFLSGAPLARAVLGGLVASVAGGRAGVVWDPADPEGESLVRSARGLALGAATAATACLATVVAAELGGIAVVKMGHPSWTVGLALLAAVGGAVRDEVVLRAIPLHYAERAGLPTRAAVAFAAVASPATIALSAGASAVSLSLALAQGLLSARLFERTKSLWTAVGANVAFTLLAGPLLGGGLFDVIFQRGELVRGPTASGAPAVLAAVFLALAALGAGRGPLRLDAEPPRAPRSPRSPRR